MKKFLFIISLFAIVAMAQAQNSTIFTFIPGASNNVLYNGTAALGDTSRYSASIVTRVMDLRRATGLLDYVIATKVTQTSGDIAGTDVKLQGSADGSAWVNIRGVALSNATTTTTWNSIDTITKVVAYPYLRIRMVSDGGTGVATLTQITGKIVPHYPPK